MNKLLLVLSISSMLCCFACSKNASQTSSNADSPSADVVANDTTPEAAKADVPESPSANNNEGKINIVDHESVKNVEKMTFNLKTQTYGIEKIDARLTQAVNAFVASEIGEFNDTFGEDKDAEMDVTIQQETVRADKNGVDVVFKIDRVISSAAHPSGEVMTFMFDENGAEIPVASLSESGAFDREKAKAKCLDSIVALLEDEGNDLKSEIEQALNDNPFEHVVRTDHGFRVFFEPEEILGPYRAIIEVDVDAK